MMAIQVLISSESTSCPLVSEYHILCFQCLYFKAGSLNMFCGKCFQGRNLILIIFLLNNENANLPEEWSFHLTDTKPGLKSPLLNVELVFHTDSVVELS